MKNIKLTLEYDGKRYLGWQRLGDSDKTIQGKVESIISQMTGEELEIVGSGRTDAGTHARGQVANFKTATELTTDKMQDYLNRYLPQDIVVKEVVEVPERFHSRYNAKGKQYSYNVWNGSIPTALQRQQSFHYSQPIDVAKLNEACRKLEGEHDFIGFSSLKKSKKSTLRTLNSVNVTREGEMLHFTFVGEGFLYNMVRIIVGTLLEIGAGKMDVSIIDEIFTNKVRKDAGETVPAHALFLDEVYY